MYLVFPGLLPAKTVPEHGTLIAQDSSRRPRRDRQAEENAVGGVGEEGQSTATTALNAERYRPRIYGFQVHEIARWQRWQEAMRDRQFQRLLTHEQED